MMKKNNRTTVVKSSKKKPLSTQQLVLMGLGGGLIAGLGYMTYSHFRNKAAQKRSSMVDSFATNDIITSQSDPITSNEFPLQQGARGNLVAMLQNALLAKGGQAALIIKETSFRNGKEDGIFGKGTQRALQAAGFPSVITQSDFRALVGSTNKGVQASSIAKGLIDAANSRNLFAVLKGLQQITSVEAYRNVSAFFKGIRITGTRVTSLVNALLSVAFRNKELEKLKIRAEFRRMGLQQNAKGIWFIPSLGNLPSVSNAINYQWNLAIAAKPTLLKASDGSFIVPQLQPKTVIGYITGITNDVTRILTQSGETVFAPTKNLSVI